MATKVKLFPYQIDFMKDDTTKEVLLLGGIGTGKSWVLANDLIKNLQKYKGIKILLAANTYSQLMNATVSTLIECFETYGIPYKMVESGAKKRIEALGGKIFLYSLEKYDNIRGIQVGLIYLDEVCFAREKALQTVRGRLRSKIGPLQIKMTSSPNGFNFMYDIFEGKDIAPTKGKRLIRAITSQNRHLPAGYYESLLEAYGGELTPLARQELFGEFVNLIGGQIFNGFDRKKNCKALKLNPNYPVYVGVDFNIDKMSATYIQYIQNVFYLIQEVQLTHNNANTLDLSTKIINDLQGFQVYVVPDSTGKNRHSSATSTISDHAIMKEMGLNIMPTSNPFIRDRQNNINTCFYKNTLWIDPACKETIREIESLSNRDQEGKVAHLSVTLGYVLWKIKPLKTTIGTSSSRHL